MNLIGLTLLTALWAADHAYEELGEEPIVAAVAYTGNTPPDGNFECEELADSDIEEELCEAEILVREAADQGARIVVLSEGSFEIEEPERLPRKGRLPDPELSPISRLTPDCVVFILLYESPVKHFLRDSRHSVKREGSREEGWASVFPGELSVLWRWFSPDRRKHENEKDPFIRRSTTHEG